MIVTVSPHVQNKHESLSTLRYGSKAQKIKNRPQINTRPSMDLKGFKKVRAHFGETPAKTRFRPNQINANQESSKSVQAQQALQKAEKQINYLDRVIFDLRNKIQELESAHEVDQNRIRELRLIIVELEK